MCLTRIVIVMLVVEIITLRVFLGFPIAHDHLEMPGGTIIHAPTHLSTVAYQFW